MGMSSRDLMIGLMTAMQESSLRNLNYGDRDSLGLFQQRPSQGWGNRDQVTDPVYASQKFFSALKKVRNRERLQPWEAAQAVQRSANGLLYRQWQRQAELLVKKSATEAVDGRQVGLINALPPQARQQVPTDPNLMAAPTELPNIGRADYLFPDNVPVGLGRDAIPEGLGRSAGMDSMPEPAAETDEAALEALLKKLAGDGDGAPVAQDVSGKRAAIIEAAKKHLGTPYVWGGKGPAGFDCSGIIYYIYNRFGVRDKNGHGIPRVSQDQAMAGRWVNVDQLQPADLVVFNTNRNAGNYLGHIAIYLGNGMILEAPRTGLDVRIRKLRKGEDVKGVQLDI